MSDTLTQLRMMTDSLPRFPISLSDAPGDAKIHEMEQGTSIAWELLHIPEITVARWFNSANTVFPEHAHKEREWLIVYKGSMVLSIPKQPPKRLLSGTSVIIEANTPHYITFMEDCWYLAITVPQTKDFK